MCQKNICRFTCTSVPAPWGGRGEGALVWLVTGSRLKNQVCVCAGLWLLPSEGRWVRGGGRFVQTVTSFLFISYGPIRLTGIVVMVTTGSWKCLWFNDLGVIGVGVALSCAAPVCVPWSRRFSWRPPPRVHFFMSLSHCSFFICNTEGQLQKVSRMKKVSSSRCEARQKSQRQTFNWRNCLWLD